MVSYDKCINELLALELPLTMSSSPEKISKRVNKLLQKMEMPDIDVESLERKVGDLSDKAEVALLNAIKEENVEVVLKILGMKPSKEKGII